MSGSLGVKTTWLEQNDVSRNAATHVVQHKGLATLGANMSGREKFEEKRRTLCDG